VPVVVSHDPASTTSTETERLRLHAPDGSPSDAERIYGSPGFLFADILHRVGGIVSLDTPSLSWSSSVDWMTADLTATNQDLVGWRSTPEPSLSATFRYAAYERESLLYSAACYHWFRTATRGHVGRRDPFSGMAPDWVLLSGHGRTLLRNVPVVVREVSIDLADDVDWSPVEDPIDGRVLMYLPVRFDVRVEMAVVRSPVVWLTRFSLDRIRTGEIFFEGAWL